MPFTPGDLASSLRRLPPRAAQVVMRRCAPQATRLACAQAYGIDEAAFDLLLWRSAHPRTLAFDEEQRLARSLGAALEPEAALPEDPAARPTAQWLCALREHFDAVTELNAAAERAEAESPARRREMWLRRLAIVLVLALTAFFYWRQQQAPPRPEPRPSSQP